MFSINEYGLIGTDLTVCGSQHSIERSDDPCDLSGCLAPSDALCRNRKPKIGVVDDIY